MLSGLQVLGAVFVVAWLLIAVALLLDKRWPLVLLDDSPEMESDRLLDDLGSATPGVLTPLDDDLSERLLGWRDRIEAPPMPDIEAVVDRAGETT